MDTAEYIKLKNEIENLGSGGHTIENSAGTALTQRDTLQFKGGLSVSDDSTNEVTVVDDTVPEIEWSVWNAMTPQEQEAIPNAIILNAPDSGGGGDSLGEQHTVTGNPLSFTTDSAQLSNKTIVSLEPIQAGSGDPSPSNVRTISGYDDIEIIVPRKNLLNSEQAVYVVTSGGAQRMGFKPVLLSSGTYTFSYGTTDTALYFTNITDGYSYEKIESNPYTFTLSTNSEVIIRSSGTVAFSITNPQIELGSEATEYEPYAPVTDITIPAPDGTIYGGTLDVESGELVITYVCQAFDGTENFAIYNNNYIYTSPDAFTFYDMVIENNVIYGVCSHAPSSGSSTNITIDSTYISTVSGSKRKLGFKKATWESIVNPFTVENMKTYLAGQKTAGHPVQICYELATHKTYHLSPHQVKLLQGANTVTTNGTSLSLTYRDGEVAGLSDIADSVEGIDKKFQFASDTLANKTDISSISITGSTNNTGSAITSGTWFYLNGELCRAKTDIATSATLTLNTNYEKNTIDNMVAYKPITPPTPFTDKASSMSSRTNWAGTLTYTSGRNAYGIINKDVNGEVSGIVIGTFARGVYYSADGTNWIGRDL